MRVERHRKLYKTDTTERARCYEKGTGIERFDSQESSDPNG